MLENVQIVNRQSRLCVYNVLNIRYDSNRIILYDKEKVTWGYLSNQKRGGYMSSDAEFISSGNFNTKFKNYLRDFYIYQFKDRGTDFYDKGSLASVRMNAGCIFCHYFEIFPSDFCSIKMKDIQIEGNKVSIEICTDSSLSGNVRIDVCEPLSEIVKFLYTFDPSAYFLTGHSVKPDSNRLKNELSEFIKAHGQKTVNDMYKQWLEVYSNMTNDSVKPSSFRNDSLRVRSVLEQMAGITWTKGNFVDTKSGKIKSGRVNKKVECVTVDSRHIESNPFFTLYRYCSEGSFFPGAYFSFTYALLLYFQLGNRVSRTDDTPLSNEELLCLEEYLIGEAREIESKVHRHNMKRWDEFSSDEKERFFSEALTVFFNAKGNIKYERRHSNKEINFKPVYEKLILSRKKIVCKNDQFLIENDSDSFVEKNVLIDSLQHYIGVGEKQISNILRELVRVGVVVSKKIGQSIYYSVSNAFIKDMLGDNKELLVRFTDMVSFFSQTSLLGEIGSYILERLPKQEQKCIYYKHNYLKCALNDYNHIDILYAIKNKLWLAIEYRNAAIHDLQYQRFICYPIEIRESVTDGRQYLIYYHPGYRSVSAVRIEFIDSIMIGHMDKGENFNEDIVRARKLISYTWGTAFDNFQEGNVKTDFEPNIVHFRIRYEEKEMFIKSRIQREIRNCASFNEVETEDGGHCLEIVAVVANPWEILHWLRSYIGRIVTIEINGVEYQKFAEDVVKTHESYLNSAVVKESASAPSDDEKSILIEPFNGRFLPADHMHSLLFHELYGISFNKLGDLLFEIIKKGKVSEKFMEDKKTEYAALFSADRVTTMKRLEQADGFIRDFVSYSKSYASSIFSITEGSDMDNIKDILPLTSIEIQWLQNILHHPLATCFLTKKEIEAFCDWLPPMHLFDINTVVLHDQFLDIESFYQQQNFGTTARDIMKAIRENLEITIQYKSQYEEISDDVCYPAYAEYSKRDHKIRIRAVSQSTNSVKTFNLERILNVRLSENKFDAQAVRETVEIHTQKNERELVLLFRETKNVPDRILTEFSCFKKKCVKWGDDRYRMTLFYNIEDKREIIVRLLSYGSLIFIFDDTGDVRHELIERLERQMEL